MKFTQKWAIIAPLEPIQEGSEFPHTEFPLHITLMGVFAVDKNSQQLAIECSKELAHQQAFQVTAGPEAMFGPDKSVKVTTIQPSHELTDLHMRLYDWLVRAGAVFNDPQYQGSGFGPHSTVQKKARLLPGQQVTIGSLALIDLFPHGDGLQRKVTKIFALPKPG